VPSEVSRYDLLAAAVRKQGRDGQRMPFQAHAWVEVEGKVVNDKPHVQDHYAVLDRC